MPSIVYSSFAGSPNTQPTSLALKENSGTGTSVGMTVAIACDEVCKLVIEVLVTSVVADTSEGSTLSGFVGDDAGLQPHRRSPTMHSRGKIYFRRFLCVDLFLIFASLIMKNSRAILLCA